VLPRLGQELSRGRKRWKGGRLPARRPPVRTVPHNWLLRGFEARVAVAPVGAFFFLAGLFVAVRERVFGGRTPARQCHDVPSHLPDLIEYSRTCPREMHVQIGMPGFVAEEMHRFGRSKGLIFVVFVQLRWSGRRRLFLRLTERVLQCCV